MAKYLWYLSSHNIPFHIPNIEINNFRTESEVITAILIYKEYMKNREDEKVAKKYS